MLFGDLPEPGGRPELAEVLGVFDGMPAMLGHVKLSFVHGLQIKRVGAFRAGQPPFIRAQGEDGNFELVGKLIRHAEPHTQACEAPGAFDNHYPL